VFGTVTRRWLQESVLDKFVAFFGDGLKVLPLASRATIANMSPEFGSTFPSSPSTRKPSATSI